MTFCVYLTAYSKRGKNFWTAESKAGRLAIQRKKELGVNFV